MGVTKLCEVEDFSDLRRLAGTDAMADQRQWREAMAVHALGSTHGLGSHASVLTVGEVGPVVSMLAGRLGSVSSADWSDVVELPFTDASFDAVVCGPIDHLAIPDQVSLAVAELSRVLKAPGVLSLSTRFRLHGPPGGLGWPGRALLLSGEELRTHVIDASGLLLDGELPDRVSMETMLYPRRLGAPAYGDRISTGPAAADLPVAVAGGYVFTMAHLLLRKTEECVMKRSMRVPAPGPAASARPAVREPVTSGGWRDRVVALQARLEVADRLSDRALVALDHLTTAESDIGGSLTRLERARKEVDGALAHAGTWWSKSAEPVEVTGTGSLLPDFPVDVASASVGLAEGLRYEIMVDRASADPITTTFLTGHCLFQDLVSLMLELISPGDVVLDVGAHIGTFSLAAAAAGCHVLAIEASPVNADLLRRSVHRNGFHGVRVVSAAVSDEPGTVQFCPIGPWGTVTNGRASALAREVPAVTIDELLFELGMPTPKFVKMDIEGSEIKALRGMTNMLALDNAPALLLESNGHTLNLLGVTTAELLREIEAFGYTAYMVNGRRLVPVTSAELQPRTEVDYLAAKHPPDSLQGWQLAPPLTTEERIAMLVEDCKSLSEDCRAYIGRSIGEAPPELLADPELASALDAMTEDPVEAVRLAVGWWTERNEP